MQAINQPHNKEEKWEEQKHRVNRKKMSIGVNKLTEKETEANIQKNQKESLGL